MECDDRKMTYTNHKCIVFRRKPVESQNDNVCLNDRAIGYRQGVCKRFETKEVVQDGYSRFLGVTVVELKLESHIIEHVLIHEVDREVFPQLSISVEIMNLLMNGVRKSKGDSSVNALISINPRWIRRIQYNGLSMSIEKLWRTRDRTININEKVVVSKR